MSANDFGMAPDVAAWMVTGEPRTTRRPLGWTSMAVLVGGKLYNGRVKMLKVSSTQEGLNNTIARTGTNRNPNKRRLPLTRCVSISSSILSVDSCLRVVRRRAKTIEAEKPGASLAFA